MPETSSDNSERSDRVLCSESRSNADQERASSAIIMSLDRLLCSFNISNAKWENEMELAATFCILCFTSGERNFWGQTAFEIILQAHPHEMYSGISIASSKCTKTVFCRGRPDHPPPRRDGAYETPK